MIKKRYEKKKKGLRGIIDKKRKFFSNRFQSIRVKIKYSIVIDCIIYNIFYKKYAIANLITLIRELNVFFINPIS